MWRTHPSASGKRKNKPISRDLVNNSNEIVKNQIKRSTILDLEPKERIKIANLIRKVVELDQECQQTEAKAKTTKKELSKKVFILKKQNSDIIQQHCKLRAKFQHSLKLLQMYKRKMNRIHLQQNSQKLQLQNITNATLNAKLSKSKMKPKKLKTKSKKKQSENISTRFAHEENAITADISVMVCYLFTIIFEYQRMCIFSKKFEN